MNDYYTESQVNRIEQDAHDGAILEAGKEWERQRDEFNFREYELETRIAELEQAQRWIPVNERLPERQGTTYLNARYLVLYHGHYHDINVFSPSNKKWLCGEVDKTEYVTHWMDLPDLPEEVQK